MIDDTLLLAIKSAFSLHQLSQSTFNFAIEFNFFIYNCKVKIIFGTHVEQLPVYDLFLDQTWAMNCNLLKSVYI